MKHKKKDIKNRPHLETAIWVMGYTIGLKIHSLFRFKVSPNYQVRQTSVSVPGIFFQQVKLSEPCSAIYFGVVKRRG